MLLDAPELRGLQEPPICSLPEHVSSAGEEAVELAEMAGLVLDPWQQFTLKHALGERPDGKWSAFEVALLVSRQNGKGSCLEARELAGLFLLNEQLIIHTAHQFNTSLEAFRRILYLIESTPDLDRRVKRVSKSHGEEGIELKNGNRLKFLARSGGSGRGFSCDCLIFDESMILSTQLVGNILPTLSARPNPQVWYTTSAGMPESTQLARVVMRGRRGGDPSLAYFDWCAAKEVPHGLTPDELRTWASNPELWAAANPGMGIRISAEHIERELAAMDLQEFLRERLGIGTYPVNEHDGWDVITEDQWTAGVDLYSSMLQPVAFAVDVPPDRSSATIAVAGVRPDGNKHTEIVDHAPGTSWVAERMKALKERWDPKAIALDPGGPAGSLKSDFEREGIQPLLIGAREIGQACGSFYDGITGGTLKHLGQPELNAAVKGARKRSLGDAWAWSRRDTTVNISPLVAATLALHAHGANVEVEDEETEVYFLN